MVDDITIKLMARIMQKGMTGNKIAELFNEANKIYKFYDKNFIPPGQTNERKEDYAYKWLSKLKDEKQDEGIRWIAKQLVDKSRVYFAEDKDHPYPRKEVRRLKNMLFPKTKKAKKRFYKTPSVTIKALLSCIADNKLRENIYSDIRDIERCISAKAWKPAVIICGSVLEAIFSDWLNQFDKNEVDKIFKEIFPKKNNKKIEDFTLEELIKISEKMNLIHGCYVKISDAIRNYRNLIHPNYALQQNIKPNKSIAQIGKEIIFAVLEERKKACNDKSNHTKPPDLSGQGS